MSVMIAIDFGDQFCKVAIANAPGQNGFKDPDISFLHPVLPSLLALGEDHTIKIGLDAQALRGSGIYTIIDSFKHQDGLIIGNNNGEGTFNTTQTDSGQDATVLKIKRDFGITAFSSIQLTALFLSSIIGLVSSVAHCSITKAVITVPAWFTTAQRDRLVFASKMAGLAHVGLITDAAASSLDCAVSHQDISDGVQHIVLIDIGYSGSTVMVSTFGDNKAEIKSIVSEAAFGGHVIDQALLDYLGSAVSTDQTNIFEDLKASGKLLAECQRMKEALCLSEDTSQAISFSIPFEQVSITGERLGHLIGPMSQVSALVLKGLALAGLTADQVHEVVLLGGSTGFSAIKKCITGVFPWGTPMNSGLPTAAARGAIYACSFLEDSGYFDFNDKALSGLFSGQEQTEAVWKEIIEKATGIVPMVHMPELDCSNLEEQYTFSKISLPVEHILPQVSSAPLPIIEVGDQSLSSNIADEISALQQTLDAMPDNNPEKSIQLNALATLLLTQAGTTPTIENLTLALETQVKAISLAAFIADKAKYLNGMAVLISRFFAIKPDMEMLNQGILGLQMAVALTVGDDKNKAKYLNNLSNLSHLRYEKGYNIEDLHLAITTQRDALELMPDTDETKYSFLNVFGLRLESRFDKLSNTADLKEAVSIFGRAVSLAKPSDIQRHGCLFNFGVALKKLFDQFGNMSDLENSVLYQQMAVDSASNTDEQKPMFCHHLGETLHARFLKKSNLEDLDNAIKNYQHAVKLVKNSHPSKSVYFNHLGEAFGTYFISQKSAPHMDHAVLYQRRALEISPLRNRALYLRNLAFLLETRFHSPTGNSVQDLDEAITSRQQAAVLTPSFLPEKQKHLTDLVASLHVSYKHSHNLEALAAAIFTQRDVIQLSSGAGDQDKEKHLKYMFSLGTLLLEHFDEVGSIESLEEAIVQLNEAAVNTTDNSSKAHYLSHLGAALHTRFVQLHEFADLETSIASAEQAVDLAADDNPNRFSYVNNFAQAMVTHFQNFKNTESLKTAVKLYENIVAETPDKHPQKASRLTNLGVTLLNLFEHEGRTADLHKAISISQAAIDQVSMDDANQFHYLANLANALMVCWKHIGDNVNDLDQAISMLQKIIDKVPDGHLDKAGYLNNLGNALLSRYEALGEIFDLNNGLYYQKRAVEAIPASHSQKPLFLNNLGNSLRKRFLRKSKLEDLITAIDLYQEAVELVPNNHKNKAMYVYNLGMAFMASFDFTENIKDLRESIIHQETSLQLTSYEDPLRKLILATLGDSLRQQANHSKDLSGLKNAAICVQEALEFMTGDHPEKVRTLLIQSQIFEDMFEINGDKELLQRSLEIYKQISQPQSGSPSVQFRAILRWISYALKHDKSSLMDAYACALELLPRLAWLGLSIEAQFMRIYGAQSLVSDAAATALSLGNIELALEWLENGRSVVWNQILQLRQPLDHLKEVNPSLAEKIEKLSKELNYHRAHNDSFFTDKGLEAASLYEKGIETQHKLAQSWDNLLHEVQETPGFKHVFERKPFSMLKEAARQGPVVVLNASKLRCDAIIIVSPSLPLIHLPLHQTSYDKIHHLQQSLFSLLRSDLRLRNDLLGNDDLNQPSDRHGGPAKLRVQSADDVFEHVLAELWNTVVRPVLDLLKLNIQSSTLEIPHIWWCPTSQFSFLPIHAAGIYGRPGGTTVTLADYAVSSYTPNLSVLLSARPEAYATKSVNFLAIAQANTPGQSPLPGVNYELEFMETHVSQHPFEVIKESEATVQTVLAALRNFSWIHFSCHGKQDVEIPTLSGLLLHDGILSLRQIIHESLPNAEFAFLSACQTASGDYFQPDETMHLAGGMMLAGFRSVVATMWSVGDQDAPVITDEVYKYLFRDNLNKPSGMESAVALHIAVQKLRHQYHNRSFASWVPFIHMGLYIITLSKPTHNTTKSGPMSEDITQPAVETDQVDDFLDMFYVDSEAKNLEAMEQEDVDLYNLYGDGSVTPYTRPSSPQQGVSQAEKTTERDETPNTDEIATSRLANDSMEGAVGKTAKTKKSCDEGPKDTTKQEDKGHQDEKAS